jgi:hypothetical protein
MRFDDGDVPPPAAGVSERWGEHWYQRTEIT